jgi:predicted ATP-grasp superfamily ATP-dependent carboligase
LRYLGGSVPLQPDLAHRATAIARRAIASLPEPLGYVGIDLVLGNEPNGRNDVVIEVNPRLTTSYVGLRALANDNLAAAMLAVAAGETPRLSFKAQQLEFDADGTVRKVRGEG